jgi:hypothetical protein
MVEGDDDERFIDRAVKPFLLERYNDVKPYRYANQTKKKVVKFINAIRAMKADFISLSDINDSPCVTERKQRVKQTKIGNVDDNQIIIVRKKIEGWYLAGLDERCCRNLGISTHNYTDTIDKQKFNKLIVGSKFGSRRSCMVEILKNFDIETAKRKNKSFSYFCRKFL